MLPKFRYFTGKDTEMIQVLCNFILILKENKYYPISHVNTMCILACRLYYGVNFFNIFINYSFCDVYDGCLIAFLQNYPKVT